MLAMIASPPEKWCPQHGGLHEKTSCEMRSVANLLEQIWDDAKRGLTLSGNTIPYRWKCGTTPSVAGLFTPVTWHFSQVALILILEYHQSLGRVQDYEPHCRAQETVPSSSERSVYYMLLKWIDSFNP